ncbi:MAG: hypothetical protein RhofKO_20120 [Rhodothermales bacterium]
MRSNLQFIPAAVGSLLLLLTFSSCDVANLGADIEDAVNLVISVPPIETMGTIHILDASTGESITDPVAITFEGRDADQVVDQFLFEPLTTSKTSNGVFSFAFPDGVVYTEGAPFRITMKASAPGYLGASVKINIDRPGRYSYRAKLVKASAPPAGIVIATQPAGTTDGSGTTQSTVSVATPTDATTGASAVVTIPAGTQVTTASGQPALGALTATVTYNDVQTQQAQAVASATTTGVEVAQSDGTTTEGALLTQGTFQIQMEDGAGNEVRELSQPMTLTVPLPEINPLTGQAYRIGDPLTVYAQNVDTGIWEEVTTAEVAGKRGQAAGRVVKGGSSTRFPSLASITTASTAPHVIGMGVSLTKLSIDPIFDAPASLVSNPLDQLLNPSIVDVLVQSVTDVLSNAIFELEMPGFATEVNLASAIDPTTITSIAQPGVSTDAQVILDGIAEQVASVVTSVPDYTFVTVNTVVNPTLSVRLPTHTATQFQLPSVTSVISTTETVILETQVPFSDLADGAAQVDLSQILTQVASVSATINSGRGRVDLQLDCSAVSPGQGTIQPSTQFQYARRKPNMAVVGGGGALAPSNYVSPPQTGDLVNGKTEVTLELSTTYLVSVNYKGETYRQTFTTPPSNDADGGFDVPISLSDDQIRQVCSAF